MNAKKCKKLRKLAERMTVGLPEVAYVTGLKRQRVIDPESTRGFYLMLKAAAPSAFPSSTFWLARPAR